jgi:hypothetical protein
MSKKTYTPPTITEHGDVVKQTTGFGGAYWELSTNKGWTDPDDPPILPPPPPGSGGGNY